MSDNIPLPIQQSTTARGDSEYYNVDVFSYVQPPEFGTRGSQNQLIVYITRTLENSSGLAFNQVWKWFMVKRN